MSQQKTRKNLIPTACCYVMLCEGGEPSQTNPGVSHMTPHLCLHSRVDGLPSSIPLHVVPLALTSLQ